MAKSRFLKAITFATLGLASIATPDMAAAQPAPAAETAPDPAKVNLTIQIYSNLKIVEILTSATVHALAKEPETASLTPAQKEKLLQLFQEAMMAKRDVFLYKLAAAHCGPYTTEQLTTLVNLSKIKYIQDMLAQGAGELDTAPDPATLTPAETAFLTSLDNQPYVTAFLQDSANFDAIEPDLNAMYEDVATRFAAWQKTVA